MGKITGSNARRFWKRVNVRPDGCWTWTAPLSSNGYGRFYADATTYSAHRYALILSGVEIPPGMCVLHSCDNPSCVRPSHLRVGSHQENMRDMAERKRNPGPRMKGTDNPSARLSEADVLAIRTRYAAGGVTQQTLADEYGVRQTMISQIVLRQAWAHVKEGW